MVFVAPLSWAVDSPSGAAKLLLTSLSGCVGVISEQKRLVEGWKGGGVPESLLIGVTEPETVLDPARGALGTVEGAFVPLGCIGPSGRAANPPGLI